MAFPARVHVCAAGESLDSVAATDTLCTGFPARGFDGAGVVRFVGRTGLLVAQLSCAGEDHDTFIASEEDAAVAYVDAATRKVVVSFPSAFVFSRFVRLLKCMAQLESRRLLRRAFTRDLMFLEFSRAGLALRNVQIGGMQHRVLALDQPAGDDMTSPPSTPTAEPAVALTAEPSLLLSCPLCGTREGAFAVHEYQDVDAEGNVVHVCVRCYDGVLAARARAQSLGYLYLPGETTEEICTLCAIGGHNVQIDLYMCANATCPRAFCKDCIQVLLPPLAYDAMLKDEDWLCPSCARRPNTVLGYTNGHLRQQPAMTGPEPGRPAPQGSLQAPPAQEKALVLLPRQHGEGMFRPKKSRKREARPPIRDRAVTITRPCPKDVLLGAAPVIPKREAPRPPPEAPKVAKPAPESAPPQRAPRPLPSPLPPPRRGPKPKSAPKAKVEATKPSKAKAPPPVAPRRLPSARPPLLPASTPLPPVDKSKDEVDYFWLYICALDAPGASARVDTDDACFACKDGGELIECDYEGPDGQRCLKVYHDYCLGYSVPDNEVWRCPSHHCEACGGFSTRHCRYCPTSFCDVHAPEPSLRNAQSATYPHLHPERELVCKKCALMTQRARDRGLVRR